MVACPLRLPMHCSGGKGWNARACIVGACVFVSTIPFLVALPSDLRPVQYLMMASLIGWYFRILSQ
jgi:hypothetical protein